MPSKHEDGHLTNLPTMFYFIFLDSVVSVDNEAFTSIFEHSFQVSNH